MNKRVSIPESYKSPLCIRDTQVAIKKLKEFFESELEEALNLTRVDAPLLVQPETGLNDNLNGVERAVSFDTKDIPGQMEVVQSLAKWKRDALSRYGFLPGEGLYTDMVAIRRDEDLSNIHSITVRQWDWERVITREDRNPEFLRNIVRSIYGVMKKTEMYSRILYPVLNPELYPRDSLWNTLPDDIFFITTQELEDRFPHLTPKEREHAITREKGAVFISQVGCKLQSGSLHDGRAADYDDWTLNGDILVWNTVLGESLELSSMGIRVDSDTLRKQSEERGTQDRLSLQYHQGILNDTLPLTIGGGIGQSRVFMYFLRKCHIGEVQASVWPKEVLDTCTEKDIQLL